MTAEELEEKSASNQQQKTIVRRSVADYFRKGHPYLIQIAVESLFINKLACTIPRDYLSIAITRKDKLVVSKRMKWEMNEIHWNELIVFKGTFFRTHLTTNALKPKIYNFLVKAFNLDNSNDFVVATFQIDISSCINQLHNSDVGYSVSLKPLSCSDANAVLKINIKLNCPTLFKRMTEGNQRESVNEKTYETLPKKSLELISLSSTPISTQRKASLSSLETRSSCLGNCDVDNSNIDSTEKIGEGCRIILEPKNADNSNECTISKSTDGLSTDRMDKNPIDEDKIAPKISLDTPINALAKGSDGYEKERPIQNSGTRLNAPINEFISNEIIICHEVGENSEFIPECDSLAGQGVYHFMPEFVTLGGSNNGSSLSTNNSVHLCRDSIGSASIIASLDDSALLSEIDTGCFTDTDADCDECNRSSYFDLAEPNHITREGFLVEKNNQLEKMLTFYQSIWKTQRMEIIELKKECYISEERKKNSIELEVPNIPFSYEGDSTLTSNIYQDLKEANQLIDDIVGEINQLWSYSSKSYNDEVMVNAMPLFQSHWDFNAEFFEVIKEIKATRNENENNVYNMHPLHNDSSKMEQIPSSSGEFMHRDSSNYHHLSHIQYRTEKHSKVECGLVSTNPAQNLRKIIKNKDDHHNELASSKAICPVSKHNICLNNATNIDSWKSSSDTPTSTHDLNSDRRKSHVTKEKIIQYSHHLGHVAAL